MWLESICMIQREPVWAEYYQSLLVANATMKMVLVDCTCTHRGGSTIKSWILPEAITLNIMEAWECPDMVLDLECKTPTENIPAVTENKKQLVVMVLH